MLIYQKIGSWKVVFKTSPLMKKTLGQNIKWYDDLEFQRKKKKKQFPGNLPQIIAHSPRRLVRVKDTEVNVIENHFAYDIAKRSL